jgi:protein SCO1/2
VNFIGSLVNRHRIELFILDRNGRVAETFERTHWAESDVIERAVAVANEKPAGSAPDKRGVAATIATLALALLPKCPVCWAAYLSVFGIGGVKALPLTPALQPLLFALVLVNVVSVWLRSHSTGRMTAAYLVLAGAAGIILSRTMAGWDVIAWPGLLATAAGSILSARSARQRLPH